MAIRAFKLWHSLAGLAVLLAFQGVLVYLWPVGGVAWLTLLCAVAGSVIALYVATEVIEQVRNTERMLVFLSGVVAEFVVFFAFEYWFLATVSTTSFPTLPIDPVSLLLHSTMIFVFNPLYLPTNLLGRALLLVNTASALSLVLFILQNIWQIRRPQQ